MTNVLILKGKLAENNITQEAVADKMGITRSTFYRKMKENGKSFTVEEVHKLVKILSLTTKDVMKIFFAS
jgi:predicted DNA-binding protein (UPF0251 family)